ncbi:MAG TPA: 3'-5' exonuclease [Gemmatimonadales bacterium]
MHDAAAQEGRALTLPGVAAHASGTLLERALRLLAAGPANGPVIAREVLGMPRAPALVADRLAVALLGADPRVRRDHLGQWVLAQRSEASTTLADTVFAVVDVETTGSRPTHGDRITEIAVVLVTPGGRIETVLETLVNPERPIPSAVTRVTQITNAMVQDQPVFGEVADELLGALGGRVFVAHNVQFDWRFLEAEVRRARDLRLDGPRLCTVKLARRLIPGLKHRGLDSVSRYFGVEIEGRHRAGGDARATARILTRLLDLGTEQGAVTLDDLTRVDARVRARKTAGPGWMEAI